MRGTLRHADGVCHLSPRLTYVGREGCDIVIKSPFVDSQHALFEYSEDDGCFVMQDLNSSQGTYVNDCRIQNAAVRLAHRDVIRFGFNGPVYQLELEDAGTAASGASRQPPRTAPSRSDPYNPPAERGFPALGASASATGPALQPLWMQPPASGSSTVPRLQQQQQSALGSVRHRPATAGSWRAVTFADTNGSPAAWTAGQQQATAPSLGLEPGSSAVTSWPATDDLLRTVPPATRPSGFVNFEAEMEMKDQLVEQLTSELTKTRQRLQAALASLDQDAASRVPVIEQELEAKKSEVATLKEQLQQVEKELSKRAATVRDSETSKIQEICDLKNELERVKKDKSITAGLVTQMHRDMTGKQMMKALHVQSRDVTISRLTREIESLKKEVRDRDVQIATSGLRKGASARAVLQRDEPEDVLQRDKVVATLTNQLKVAESKLQAQTELCGGLRAEVDRAKHTVAELQDSCRKLRSEVDSCRTELTDVHRAERTVRIDLEQALRKYERLHGRVVQVAYSMPGAERPSHEVKEDELMDALRKTIDERSSMLRQIADLKDKVRSLADGDAREELALRRLREHLAAAEDRLKSTGLLAACLRQEMTLLQTLSTDGNESVQTTKAHVQTFLALQLSWQQEIEAALEKAGIHAKLSRDPTRQHVDELATRWRQALADKDASDGRVRALEAQHRAELDSLKLSAKQELAGRIADALDKARSESEDRQRRALDDLRQLEEEMREQAVETERRRSEELESCIADLRQSLLEQQMAERERLEAAAETTAKLEEMARNEDELKRRLQEFEALKAAEVKALVEQLEDARQGSETEAAARREQAQQLAATGRSLEERLAKATKKGKELGAEVSELKQTIKELKSKPPKTVIKEVPPPKPQVIVQKEIVPDPSSVSTINALRSECAELKRRLQEQQDAASEARRDLAAAEARRGGGELSDEQKRMLSESRALAAQKEREVGELQQQLAKLSHIAERQAAEIKQHEAQASKLKAELLRWRSEAEAAATAASGTRGALEEEQKLQRSHSKEAEESRVEAELTALGAACRGDRHGQVLERQREALAELRRRVKELETLRPGTSAQGAQQQPPVAAADVALQQAAVVKRELDELRTSHALEERSRLEISSMAAVERAVSRARGITPATDAEAELERSAHRETSQALDESEKSYVAVVKSVAEALDIASTVDRVRSIAHLPKDERERLAAERERLRSALADKVKAMCERLSHKDRLLSDYERDLAKLRRSEELVERKSQQVDALADEVQRRLDEVMYLRETLGRTKERLFQEKRLNSAIKQKKTFHLERETREAPLPPTGVGSGPAAATAGAHRCAAEDPFAADTATKKRQVEKLKKKNYEIRMLKDEVARQDLELYHVTTRLTNVAQRSSGSSRSDA